MIYERAISQHNEKRFTIRENSHGALVLKQSVLADMLDREMSVTTTMTTLSTMVDIGARDKDSNKKKALREKTDR